MIVESGEARLLDGTIAGSLLSINKGVRNFVKSTGVEIYNAIKMVSLKPIKLLGIDNFKGSIKINKDADMVIFNEEFNVMHTFVKGREVYKR